ncbi:glycosyltransferase [Bacillus infantis]|uniref:glycosyltransferase n=1 Tax=Bacillus infantis TaxID=324767 RepID=UPI001CD60643|nr:glycosyltransferase [Bacillus infantis]MCA1041615.1 glycosyltransferase [Bacillus infantis]
MEKIFFYSNIRVYDQTIGITKKVMTQINAFKEMGYEVYYSGYLQDGVGIFDINGSIIKKKKYPTKSSRLNRYLRRWSLLDIVTEFIKETHIQFNYGYLRFHFFDHSYLRLLKALKSKGLATIVEAHAYPYKTGKFSLNPILILDSIYTPYVKNYIDLVAGICDTDNIWGVKTVNIDNAIDLNKISIQNKKEFKQKSIRIISVANETRFHSYDKAIKGLHEYYKNGGDWNITLNLVGEYLDETKRLIKKYGLEDKVTFYGKLYGEDLDKVYDISDLGLGAFSYRKNETTGSCLKTKEYFAKGIPFINGWREPAFDDTYPYVKRFETSLDIIDFKEVVNFYEGIKEENISQKMRVFAEEHYSWISQFQKVFEKIKA